MSESKEPPRLPDVVDEAGPSPRWLPWLGVGLFCLVAALIAARQVVSDRAAAGDEPAEVAASDQGAAGAAAAPEAKPGGPAAAQAAQAAQH